MQEIKQAIEAGYAAFQRGALDEARRELGGVRHPKAMHLLALVEQKAGNARKAARLLRRAADLDPDNVEIASNRALLAAASGELELAEAEYGRALKLQPGFPSALSGLAKLLLDAERYDEALEHYRALETIAPRDVNVRFGLATALLGHGEAEQAHELFDGLVSEGQVRPEVRFMRGRSRLQTGQIEAAVDDLSFAHRALANALTLRALANTYWMLRDESSFEALLQGAASQHGLAATAAEIYRQSGKPDAALATVQSAGLLDAADAEGTWIAATSHIDRHEPDRAEEIARTGLATAPRDDALRRSLTISLLMQGKAQEAMPVIEAMRRERPLDQLWIAYEATALRLMGSERYDALVDLERFVRAYELEPPEGFDTIASFNAAFRKALDDLHVFATHPLDQSLRDGSQTPRDLTTIDDPIIKGFYTALEKPIRQYMRDVGTGNDHPLTARNTGDFRIAGSWSVRLHGGGWHVNHVHPEGWISSSYYVVVPEETASDPDRAGWIKFGEPPFATTPECPPEKWIAPQAGTLVLFPSFLWHGTAPIHDGAERITAPFDAVPLT